MMFPNRFPPAVKAAPEITLNRMVDVVVRISGGAVSHGIAAIIRIAWIGDHCEGEKIRALGTIQNWLLPSAQV